MSALVGRKVIVREGASVVFAGIQSKDISFNRELIPITSDDDDGYRKHLEDAVGEMSVDISADGVIKDDNILTWAVSQDNTPRTFDIEITGIGTISGDFCLGASSVAAPFNEAATISAEFASDGSYTFAPATV